MKRSERMGLARLRAQERAAAREELRHRKVDEARRREAESAAGDNGLDRTGSWLPRTPRLTSQEAMERLRRAAPAFVAVSHRAVASADKPRRDGTAAIEIEQALAKAPRKPGLRFRSQDKAEYEVRTDGSLRRLGKSKDTKAAKRARRRARLTARESAKEANPC